MFLISLISLISITNVFGHNWLNSISRVGDGRQASTKAPSVPSKTGLPIVQVIAGQKFPIEWVNGHGGWVYFTLLSADDSDKMQEHVAGRRDTSNVLEEYLDGCPANQQGSPDEEFMNYHYKYDDTTLLHDPVRNKDGSIDPKESGVFSERIMPNDRRFIQRNPLFAGGMRNCPNNCKPSDEGRRWDRDKIHQFKYADRHMDDNRRCEYKNNKFPWIIAVHKYQIVRHQPNRPDVAMFEFPAGTPAGNYIVHWKWRTYYDAVDVQIISGNTPVNNPYGLEIDPNNPPEPVFQRIDHCQYPDNTPAGRCRGMRGDPLDVPQACIDDCKGMGAEECNAVAVVPITNPDSVFAAFRDQVNIPFGNQCTRPTDGSTHMCYPLKSREETETSAEYFINIDTEDPVFYSTCYHRSAPVLLAAPTQSSARPQSHFEFFGQCIDCEQRNRNSANNLTPVWSVADVCVNCDFRPAGGSVNDPRLQLYLPMDEGSGKKTAQLAATFDTKELTAVGDAVLEGSGKRGGTMRFRGDGYLPVGRFNVPGNQLTIAAWVFIDRFRFGDMRIISKANGNGLDAHVMMLSTEDVGDKHHLRARLRVVGTEATQQVVGTAAELKLGTWTHVAMTYTGARFTIFQDFQEVGSRDVSGNIVQNNWDLGVGRNPANEYRPITGRIDEVRIYNAALSADELSNL